ncbi:uncharacterized protein TM35_000242330 [Trypanosoma theileri]|uniref:Uncharacterized protein n=1 Tax=Trypanosoma theileri TaxID=67003 RepID=A0A1X0NRH0_9TRYP|nr:uncharacterized protein TM35_000242330 [Trypanosoma theileri]ORC87083.1 hypothetical protein TM35_000242330 [Trypanosoma theileri]
MSRLVHLPERTNIRGLWDDAGASEADKQLKLQNAEVLKKEQRLGIGGEHTHSAVMELSPQPTRSAKGYSRRNRSHFSLSHPQNNPVKQEWLVSPDVSWESGVSQGVDGRGGRCGRGRGRGMYASTELRDGLSVTSTAQCWSGATVNHPSMLAIRRHHDDVAAACGGGGSSRRRIDRLPVGYQLASHLSGGVESQPVGYRIRVEEETGGPRGSFLWPGNTNPARRSTSIDVVPFNGKPACGVDEASGEFVSPVVCVMNQGSGPSGLLSSITHGSTSHVTVGAACRPLLSPLLTEVDLRLRRQGLGALSDLWAACPEAMDKVLALTGFDGNQRRTILWEVRRMAYFSARHEALFHQDQCFH